MKLTRRILHCLSPLFPLLLAGCVPPIDEPNPAGAAGFVTEPSPAARGEAFTTDDGWTLRFEELVLQGSALATPIEDTTEGYSADSDAVRWNARDPIEIYTRALRVGSWRLRVGLFNSRYAYSDPDDGEEIVDKNVDPKLSKRFREPANDGDDEESFSDVPVALIILRGEKEGRVVRLEVALSSAFSFRRSTNIGEGSLEQGVVIGVSANSLTTRPLAVNAEQLFLESSGKSQRLEFAPFAEADADEDGNVTNDELRAASTCPDCDEPGTTVPDRDEPATNLLDLLRFRVGSMFVYP